MVYKNNSFFIINFLLITIVCALLPKRPLAQVDTKNYIPSYDTVDTIFIDTTSATGHLQDSTTAPFDSLKFENTTTKKANSSFNEIISSTASDSMVYDIKNRKITMFDSCVINYGNVHLESGKAELNMDDKTVVAKGIDDTTKNIVQHPVFVDGEQTYKSKLIKYNFETKQGYVTDVITQQGESYLHGEKIKMLNNNVINLRNGAFTTCEHDDPHFRFRFTKGKMIPDDKIVTGLTYLEIAHIPLPLGVPFGIFPLNNSHSGKSGIIVPTYGNSAERGYFLENGGYYWYINDYITLKLLGDIYTRGSWAVKPSFTYRKRYKYNGAFSFSYAQNKSGIKRSTHYVSRNDFKVSWQHRQDPKANPNHSFSANVNFVTSQYNKHNPSVVNDYLSNTFNSSIAYQTSFFNHKVNFSLNAGHTQNTIDGRMTFTFPDFALSTTKIYPFKRKVQVGKQRWYEKIYLSYAMNGKNELSSIDSLLFEGNVFDKMRNGIRHTLPVGFNTKIFNVIQWNINANYTSRWYFKYFEYALEHDTTFRDTLVAKLVGQQHYGFKAARDFGVNTSLNTTLYGMLQMRKFFIRAVRHVVTPSLSFNYTPDFGTSFWNYYKTYRNASGEEIKYSIFRSDDYSPLYGYPPDGESGNLSLSIDNSLEIKVRNKKDTITGTKKIKLIESLRLSMSYDVAKDSLNLSNLNISGRTKIIDGLQLEYSTSLCPYKTGADGRLIDEFVWKTEKRLFAPPSQSWRIGFSYNLNENTFTKKKKTTQTPDGEHAVAGDAVPLEEALSTNNVYIDWDNKWNVNISYNFNYRIIKTLQQDGSYKKTTDKINALSLSGNVNVTDKWKVGYNMKFDLDKFDMTYANFSVYRDLHCWEMRFNWVPFGLAKSWSFSINVKASMLSSMKYEKQKDMRDYQ